jgi:hypothetical protein
MTECVGCNPNGEYESHEAHVEVWSIGDEWVPVCSNRVLDWWATTTRDSYRDMGAAGAPKRWIRPLGWANLEPALISLGRAFEGLEGLVKAGR